MPLHRRRRDRGQLGHDEESCVIIHHDESPCMTHGEVVLLVLRLAESVCVIPWPLVWWCKGTYGGASLRDFGVCGAWWGWHALYSVLLKMPPPLHGLSFGSAKAQIIVRSPCTYPEVYKII